MNFSFSVSHIYVNVTAAELGRRRQELLVKTAELTVEVIGPEPAGFQAASSNGKRRAADWMITATATAKDGLYFTWKI